MVEVYCDLQIKTRLHELNDSSLNFTWERHDLPLAVSFKGQGYRFRFEFILMDAQLGKLYVFLSCVGVWFSWLFAR